ncbi:MAG TPA: M48 family metallopeptidase [Pyrinomonadaceae bacterium]|jgi:Zn-dependent protease with chaperone function
MTAIYRRTHSLSAWLIAFAIFVMPLSALAQTKISYHNNKYKPQDDVKLGRQAAAQIERQVPILRDEAATNYVERVGRRLVESIPPQFQHPEFSYYFRIVNARDINAFALPGGPMYVNRGMIEAAQSEGEMAGVMAHELAHVALRHGTAQATKAQKYSILAGIAGIAGAILAGPGAGQLGQAAVGAYFLKFSREYETEADVLGAQIMAQAGYNPRDLANMFRTIERQGSGRGGPQWLSDHPNPNNRYARINQEAALLRINQNQTEDTGEFRRIQASLRGMGRAASMEEIARGGRRSPGGGGNYPDNGRIGGRVEYPSSRYKTYTGGNLFRVSVPENWRQLAGNDSVWFAPDGAYSQNVYTHGVNLGVARAQNNNLRQATAELVNGLAQGSPNMRQQTDYMRGSIAGREALGITLSNRNEATGRNEVVIVYTTMLRNGDLFYVIALAPQDEYNNYQGVFQYVLRSIQLNG